MSFCCRVSSEVYYAMSRVRHAGFFVAYKAPGLCATPPNPRQVLATAQTGRFALGALTWKNAVNYVARRCRLTASGGFVQTVAEENTTRAIKSALMGFGCVRFAGSGFTCHPVTYPEGPRGFVQIGAKAWEQKA